MLWAARAGVIALRVEVVYRPPAQYAE